MYILLRTPNGEFSVFEAGDEGITIGRDPECTIHLDGVTISRRHARIDRRNGLLQLEDTRSRLGTFLNGSRVSGPTRLENADWIRIGGYLLLLRGEPPTDDDRITLDTMAQVGSTPSALDPARIVFSTPSLRIPNDETATTWQFSRLAEVTRTLQSLTDLDEILTLVLGIAFDVLHPDRGAVLLRDPATGEMTKHVQHGGSEGLVISQTIVRYAVDNQLTVLVGRTDEDSRFKDAYSVQAQSIQAALCCPLISRDRLLGVIYLDTTLGELSGHRDDIGLLNLVACYAAAAIDNALLLRDRRRTRHLEELDEEPLVVESKAMGALAQQLAELGPGNDPVLITGEPGTGKLRVARHLHLASAGRDAPFVVIDCKQLSARDVRSVLFGGGGPDVSLAGTGAWHSAAGGTLVLEHVEALDLLAQAALADLLAEESDAAAARPRLVATTTEKLERRISDHGFSRRLARHLDRHVVEMPRLRDRAEDILPLARLFLAGADEPHGRTGRAFSPAAEQALARAKYREANVTELREAVELAALLTEGPSIEAEHLFTGPKARNHRLEFNVGVHRLMRWFSHRRVHRTLQASATVVFAALVTACFTGGSAGRVANAVVWGLWWPALLVVFVLVGRAWCSVCPLSFLGTWTQRVWSWGRRPAGWLKDHAGMVMTALFLLIVWTEHVFSMPERPVATAIFLSSLALTAVGFALVADREVWCRYACPLGNLSACYSVSSTIHVHANSIICTSQCKTHECYKGSDAERGCPMFLHPLYLKDAHYCKLCLSCVRNCPNGSAQLWMRPPLQDIWSLGELNPSLLPLAWAIVALTPVMLAGGRHLAATETIAGFTVLCLAATLLAIAGQRSLPRWLTPTADPMPAARAAFALVVLAWGPFMAFHLGNVPGLDTLVLHDTAHASLSSPIPAGGLPLLLSLQIGVILLSACASLYSLGRVRALATREGIRPWGWRALTAGAILYSGLSIALVW